MFVFVYLFVCLDISLFLSLFLFVYYLFIYLFIKDKSLPRYFLEIRTKLIIIITVIIIT
ncbi:hypothetical protein J3Q64DRAFT_1723961 [Phycomyces blakesleeanus]|uniref:Uncharacterized protein n=1 Tax=Phycomyces blakesleeanus TaxID=4837 RepID=A0ABR3B6I9_PHYBL